MTRMRVAMVAPPWFEVPPSSYGGIESMVADLVVQLTERGHEVTLLGAGRDLTPASTFVPVFEEPPSPRLGEAIPEVVHAAAVSRILASLEVEVDPSVVTPISAAGGRGRTLSAQ